MIINYCQVLFIGSHNGTGANKGSPPYSGAVSDLRKYEIWIFFILSDFLSESLSLWNSEIATMEAFGRPANSS